MKIEELIKELDSVTIIEFKNYLVENLSELCKTKNKIQKYICKICKHTCSETTDTIVSRSHLSFNIWSNVIDNLLDGLV